MRFFPSERHHLAVCGRDLVILDVEQGDYALIAGAGEGVVFDGDRALHIDDPDLANALCDSGVISDRPAGPAPCPPALPTSSALDVAQRPARAMHLAAIVLAGLEMSVLYHGRPFASLIRRARQGRLRLIRPERCDADLMAVAAAFDQSSPWIPWQGECLFRCFMLLRALDRLGYAPRWVFGVRTWPFAAHCWLQAGDVALTDFADTLQPFTPIMAT